MLVTEVGKQIAEDLAKLREKLGAGDSYVPHTHRELVEGCFRCELNRDEMEAERQDELLSSLVGSGGPWPDLETMATAFTSAGIACAAGADSLPHNGTDQTWRELAAQFKAAAEFLAGFPVQEGDEK